MGSKMTPWVVFTLAKIGHAPLAMHTEPSVQKCVRVIWSTGDILLVEGCQHRCEAGEEGGAERLAGDTPSLVIPMCG